jgi:hypothetical protein
LVTNRSIIKIGVEKFKIKFQNIGWKSKIMQKRATFSISINKLVAVGCNLKKGEELYCYLAEDSEKRPIMIIYLDSKRKNEK